MRIDKGQIYILTNHPHGLVRVKLHNRLYFRRDIMIDSIFNQGKWHINSLRIGGYFKRWWKFNDNV